MAEMNAKYPDKKFLWAGCNIWRTLEWILPHPPPFHTFEVRTRARAAADAHTAR